MRKAALSACICLLELAAIDQKFIHEPWHMTAEEQQAAGVEIGKDSPAPLVDHATARKRTLEICGAPRTLQLPAPVESPAKEKSP